MTVDEKGRIKKKGIAVNEFKTIFIAVGTSISAALGILAVPMYLLMLCNVIDYVTGIIAASERGEKVTSIKGIKGIIKKVCLWLLVLTGWVIDQLIIYSASTIGLSFSIPFLVAAVVAVWLICNEILSILENLMSIGVDIPPFLEPLTKLIKGKAEESIKEE